MIRILTDNDVNGYIISGVLHRKPSLDLIRVVDVNLATADDATILAWAAAHDRIVLSSDRSTMRTPADRVGRVQRTRGVGRGDCVGAAPAVTSEVFAEER